jgi:CBS domain-containing protein
MENARPSSLREDIWPRSDRALPGQGEFTKGATVHRRTDSPWFICFASQAGVALSWSCCCFGSTNFLDDMDVSGTIGAILGQKSKDIFSIRSDALVSEAIEMMDEKNVGALLVMDGGQLNGIISERDYTRKIFLRGKRSRETKVSEIMSTNVTITHPREPVEKCLRLMTDKHIRHLPVVEGDQVVGVISIGDLVKHVISCQQAAIAHLENYIHGGYAAG